MIESLLIIGAVLASFSGMEYERDCTVVTMELVEIQGLQAGVNFFEYKGHDISLSMMYNGNIVPSSMVMVAFTEPLEDCVPLQ